LDELFYRLLCTRLDAHFSSWADWILMLRAKIWNLQSKARAFQIGVRHYDLGNDLFRAMLDDELIYSCGYWENASTLHEAQAAKLELIAAKLQLSPGMTILDIGCGWGGAAKYFAKRYKVKVVGITVSEKQAAYAAHHCRGLPIEIRLQDYRAVGGEYDRIFSIGMFEHVGRKNYRVYLDTVRKRLVREGMFLLHTIAGNVSYDSGDAWTEKHIFPNSMLPSAKQIAEASEGIFVLEDVHNFGFDYERTLLAWFRNFESEWAVLQNRYEERFYRMWKYFLLSYAGAFRARRNQVFQIVFSPDGVRGGYRAQRWTPAAAEKSFGVAANQ
ncbi:MAG TPA: cyclopropane fatty acyl phospholipid synthase, partial [Oligoflexia bacterium]|nr:cyclopropane fatty acyl phospholipid synthase [Oligoflexia bacterium]